MVKMTRSQAKKTFLTSGFKKLRDRKFLICYGEGVVQIGVIVIVQKAFKPEQHRPKIYNCSLEI